MMYQRVLVALDGSELAERVLPHVAALAEKFHSTVTLLRATESPATIIAETSAAAEPVAAGVIDPQPIVEAEQQTAADYLEATAKRLRAGGLAINCEHPEGPPAEAILARARELQADLIAMTTHGRSGLGRLVFGSVADQVLRHAPCPVLLMRINDDGNRAQTASPPIEAPII